MRMFAQPSHGLGFKLDACQCGLIQLLGLDQGEGYVPVQDGIVGQIDFLLAALSQELLDLIAAARKGVGVGSRNRRSRCGLRYWGGCEGLTAFIAIFLVARVQITAFDTLYVVTKLFSAFSTEISSLAVFCLAVRALHGTPP
jgi:hypothetical protein